MAFQHVRFTPAAGCPATPWALTPRFHLDLAQETCAGQLFSVALSVPQELHAQLTADPALNRYIALCCPDFPLCLSA